MEARRCVGLQASNLVVQPLAPSPALVSVRRGRQLWDDFLHATELDSHLVEAAVILDYHDVVDTMSFDEAAELGTVLDNIGATSIILCSYGFRKREKGFDETLPWAPLIHECDGYVFTDFRVGWHASVDVYQDAWMIDLARERFRDPSMCIGVRGDKGQVAALTRKPCIMFDDKEENIDLLRERATDRVPLDGFAVRRGRKHGRAVFEGFKCTTDCELWPGLVWQFLYDVRARKRGFGARAAPLEPIAGGERAASSSGSVLASPAGWANGEMEFVEDIVRCGTTENEVHRACADLNSGWCGACLIGSSSNPP